ncbi:MAG: DNA-binding protein [Clostridia bacterium]|nr:DNA-binding protein [Clostridia bacterium]
MEYVRNEDFLFLRLEKGEEIMETLNVLCRKENILAGIVSGIGATNDVTVGLFDMEKKSFFQNTYTGDREITSLAGNISCKDGQPYYHLHITVADGNNQVLGGHLSRCVISVTAEITVIIASVKTDRTPDENGINLLHFPNA